MKIQTIALTTLFIVFNGLAIRADETGIPQLNNPMTVDYLKKNLHPTHPRIVLTPEIERGLREKIKTDSVLQNMYLAVGLNADQIYEKELIAYRMKGKRLLSVSRDMLWRMNVLGLVYRMERDPKALDRINDELVAACNFQDWNPNHFLDVAEMSLAVALALDWTAGDLPESTVGLAKLALIEKALKPGQKKGVFNSKNNWNQVCNGGMVAAAIAVAEVDPELAAETLQRALKGLPVAMAHYGPDGTHPEGSTYWEYATSYNAITASMLESAFGTDFGIWKFPGFADSARYRLMMSAPSGLYYNYGDCGDRRHDNGDLTLAWFAAKTGDRAFFEQDRFLHPPAEMGTLDRYVGIGMAWLSQFEASHETIAPTAWAGRGINPVVVFRGSDENPHSYYLGAKGGCGSVSHGNMDAGSFVLELDGVRWSIEVGKQDYNTIEQTGLNLWDSRQQGDRWKLLSKNNYGHSTLTLNGAPHLVDGTASLIEFKPGPVPKAVFDLSPAFGDLVASATRTFIKDTDASVVIKDSIVESEKTEQITWQLITTAEIESVTGGAILRQAGKVLRLENLTHPQIAVSVVSLDPPPLELDRRVDGLKRVELKIPGTAVSGQETTLEVRLSLNDGQP
jgi:hypothetical protein